MWGGGGQHFRWLLGRPGGGSESGMAPGTVAYRGGGEPAGTAGELARLAGVLALWRPDVAGGWPATARPQGGAAREVTTPGAGHLDTGISPRNVVVGRLFRWCASLFSQFRSTPPLDPQLPSILPIPLPRPAHSLREIVLHRLRAPGVVPRLSGAEAAYLLRALARLGVRDPGRGGGAVALRRTWRYIVAWVYSVDD